MTTYFVRMEVSIDSDLTIKQLEGRLTLGLLKHDVNEICPEGEQNLMSLEGMEVNDYIELEVVEDEVVCDKCGEVHVLSEGCYPQVDPDVYPTGYYASLKDWHVFDSSYIKRFYDVKLPDGTIIHNCYPNGGIMNTTTQSESEGSWKCGDNIMIRLSVEANEMMPELSEDEPTLNDELHILSELGK